MGLLHYQKSDLWDVPRTGLNTTFNLVNKGRPDHYAVATVS